MSDPSRPASLGLYYRLISYIRPHWPYFVLSVIGFVVFAVSNPALASLMKDIEEAFTGGEQTRMHYLKVPALMLGIFAVRGLGTFVGNFFMTLVARSLVHRLRTELFGKLVVLPTGFYDSHPSGELIYRVTALVDNVTGAITRALTILIREGATVIALLAFLLWLDAKMTLIFLATAPMIAGVVTWASKRMRRLSLKMQESRAEITHIAAEAINGQKEIKAYGAQARELGRFTAASLRNLQQELKRSVTSEGFTPLVQLIYAVAFALLLGILLHPVFGADNLGALLQYVTAAALMPKSIRQLTTINSVIQQGLAACEDIFGLLDAEQEADRGDYTVDRALGEITIRHLCFRYPGADQLALTDINLTIPAGRSVAIVGRSGSGKTTLANLIARFYPFDEGEILLDGHDIRDYRLDNYRHQIAIVSQQVTLFNATIAENIAFGHFADASREAIEAAARAAYVHEFLGQQSEGLDTLVGEDGVNLSGGQRQRIAIARALLKNAPVLILDEATSALDNESERFIQDAIETVMAGRTTIVIAHRLSTIENADLIVVMNEGRILETGTHAELLARGTHYARLHRTGFNNGDNSETGVS